MKAQTIPGRTRRGWPGWLTVRGRTLRRLRLVALCLGVSFTFAAVDLGAVPFATVLAPPAHAASAVSITGAGSTWAYPAINAWTTSLNQQSQLNISYQENGSSAGRSFFTDGQADWAASEIPYGVVDGANTDTPPTTRNFAYIPDVAGGTTLVYNLQINGQQVTNLRLSGKTVADIFTNKVTYWDDPEIKADNPQLALPHLGIVPVVRSDGAGATADFTQWMLATNPAVWQAYCTVVGRSPCTQTSVYPIQDGTAMNGQPQDSGVATYVAQAASNGSIGYVEYAWALKEDLPVAKLLNADGYYTLPTPGHVAVSLLQDQINTDASNPSTYLTQNLANVYTNMDARNYELSAYSYLILPTDLRENMSTDKGYTIGLFGSYLLCTGQTQVDALGYSALPINLVEDGFAQLQKVPGSTVPTENSTAIASCNNPTFSTDGTNKLATNDPQPLACDKQGTTQCAAGVAEPGEANVSSTVTSGNSSTTSTSTTGTTGTTGSTGSSGATVTSPTGGATSAAAGSTGTGQNCDPNTGVCTPAAGSTTKAGGSATSGSGTTGTGTTGSSTTGTGTTGSSTTGTGTTGSSTTGTGSAGSTVVGGSGALAGSGQPVNDTPITLAGSNGSGLEVTLMALAAGMMFLLSVVPPLIAQAGKRSRQRRGIDEFYDNSDWPGDRK